MFSLGYVHSVRRVDTFNRAIWAMIELPENLTIRPEMEIGGPSASDLLSHVLAQIRLTGDRVYSCPLAPEGRLDLEIEAAHVCILTQGALHIEGGESGPAAIGTGDLVMLPHGVSGL